MRNRAILMLLLAAIMGVTAVFLARGWLARQVPAPVAAVQPETAPQKMSSVVVAKLPLRFGDELNRDNLRVVEWPAESVPDGTFNSIDAILEGEERRVALRDVAVNELILQSRVSGFGGRATLSALLESDMRAVTIRVNEVQGVAGFVLPGDRVDVMFTRPQDVGGARRANGAPVTDVLLQNLKVLAVDQVADNLKNQPVVAKAVTVEVSTEDAQKLTLASQVGSLSLALRSFGNASYANAGTVTVGSLMSRPQLQVASTEPVEIDEPAPVLPATHDMRIVRGTSVTVEAVSPEGAVVPPLARPAPKPALTEPEPTPATPGAPARVSWAN